MPTLFDATLYATERRAIVFVDAGFLLQVMQAHHEVPTRSALAIDHPKLIDALRSRVETTLGCPMLRIYWYDAVHPSGKPPNLVAAAMARVDGVRVRLGTLHHRSDGQWEQKAVDTLLVRDMITHAFKKTAMEMVLVSGDNDLTPGVEEAQEQGVRVHLWSIRGDDLPPSVGRDLANLADSHSELEAGELADSIRALELATTAGRSADVAPALEAGQARTVSPLDLAARPTPLAHPAHTFEGARPANLMRAPDAQTAAVFSTGDDAFPRLYDLDREAYNAPVEQAEAHEMGTTYAERWTKAAPADVLRLLRDRYDETFMGNIPRPIDADLLYFGSDHGLDTYSTPLKFALRKGFWQGIVVGGSDPGAASE